MSKRNIKPRYPQPHSIEIYSDNPALDSHLREKAHASAKHQAQLTQKQQRDRRRRERIVELSTQDRVFCEKHDKWLCAMEVVDHKCYMRHGNPPVCPYLRIYNPSDESFNPYGK